MPAQPIAFSTYPHSTPLFARGVRLVNYYAERAEGPARAPFMLMGCPGMKEFSDVTTVEATAGLECRGFHWLDSEETLYTMIGNFLFTIAADGTPAKASAVNVAGSGPVSMVSDSDQMLIITTPGTDDYLWDGTNLSQLTGANIQDWRDAAFLDGYAVVVPNDPALAGRFWFTEVNQLATVGADNFANAESSSDSLQRVLEVNRLLWMLGPESAEAFYSTGESDAPFVRHNDMIEKVGIAAASSAAVLDDKAFFLAHSRKRGIHVRMIDGDRTVRVSTNALDRILGGATISDARGFAYGEEGHEWYFLVLPSAGTRGRTFAFDAALGLDPPIWHERQSGVKLEAAWDARQAIYAHGKVLVGHKNDGKIYELDYDTHTDAGEKRMAMFTAEMRSSGERWNRLDRIRVDGRTGEAPLGAEEDGDPAPQIVRQLSKNGGRNWGRERWKSLRYAGDYGRIAAWRGGGRFKTCLARFRTTDAVPREITAVYANGTPGRFG